MGIFRIKHISLLLLVLFMLIFTGNDIFLMNTHTFRGWAEVSYLTRFIVIIILYFMYRKGLLISSDVGFTRPGWAISAAWILGLGVLAPLIYGNAYDFFAKYLSYGEFTKYYVPGPGWPRIFGSTVGIFSASLTEEIVFRGYLISALRKYIRAPGYIILLSAVCFGIAHWSMGLSMIILTAIWGSLAAVCFYMTKSIWPGIISHYLADLILVVYVLK